MTTSQWVEITRSPASPVVERTVRVCRIGSAGTTGHIRDGGRPRVLTLASCTPVTFPTFVTHYYMPSRDPFQNLSDLEDEDAVLVMEALMGDRAARLHHRLYGRKYLAMRRWTETRLYSTFAAMGGLPNRCSPHYFVLGESPWFRALAAGMREVRVPLSELPPTKTSATYGDSFEAMGTSAAFGLGPPPRAHRYAGTVVRIDEVAEMVASLGFPAADADVDYAGYEERSVEKFIEVQLWSDDPIHHYLRR